MLLAACIGLAGCGSAPEQGAPAAQMSQGPSAAQQSLDDAAPELAKLYGQGNQLLGGGASAFEARLDELKGHPVVVNKWASWCPPCRAELPMFRSQAAKHASEIAFIGVNSQDGESDARAFLERTPIGFPSYEDPDLKVAQVFKGVATFPTTAFYDADGKLAYVKQGAYATEAKLAEDIERYAR